MPRDTADAASLLDARLRISRVPAGGKHLGVSADSEACAAIAEQLAIVDVGRFEAELDIRPFRGGYQVSGQAGASVIQTCVITLEPVANEITVEVNRVFMRGQAPDRGGPPNTDDYVDAETEDEPDWFEGDWLDLGPLLIETIALALDPYPRAPGAALDPSLVGGEDEASPFAALAGLLPGDKPDSER